jgi:uroporphyrinogen decarboxylase
MQCQPTDRVPWVPFAGIHAGKLIDTPADVLYQDPDALLKALLEEILEKC